MKKIRAKAKEIIFGIKILVFVSLIIAMYCGLQYIMVDDTSSMTRIMFHEFYQKQDDIDTFFIGPSHTFRGIDAEQVSLHTGRQCFDLSTSSQRLSASYFLLKEAEKYYDTDSVYLEVSLSALAARAQADTPTYIITDYMKRSENKYQLLTANVEPEQYLNAFSPLCRSINILEKPLGLGVGKEVLYRKREEAYKNYEDKWVEDNIYCGRGYFRYVGANRFSSVKSISDISNDMHNSPENFNEKQLLYLHAIIDECKEKEIPLTIYVMPFSDLFVASQVEEYTESITYLEKMAEEKQVDFIDFNAVSRADLRLDDSCFSDFDHLNAKGAKLFIDCLSDYMTNNRAFSYMEFESAAERLEQEPNIYGVVYYTTYLPQEQAFEIEIESFANEDDRYVWKISVVDEDNVVRCDLGIFPDRGTMTVKVLQKYAGCKLRMQAVTKNEKILSVSYIPI